ncbi:MAG: tetratricopeptide repeat protein [Fimbriimonadaceae bacterium]|nr:tetratricopeptide repeat protein [Fimbriimonadaceae bacterium]
METIRVELFGSPRIVRGESATTRFRTHKTALLLALLALESGRSHLRDDLIETFWPDTEPSASRNSLSQALSSLRPLLGDHLESERDHVRLRGDLIVDVNEFRRAAKRGDHEAALKHYSGPFMLGFHDDWVLRERDGLRETLAKLLVGPGSTDLEIARAWHNRDPASELAAHHRISLAVARGDRDEALTAYAQLERTLRLVGLRPPREITDLLQREPPDKQDQPTLPQFLAAFVGRDAERRHLAELLAPTPSPILATLLGVGGTGKTRLALQVANDLLTAYLSRVWFCALADASSEPDVWRSLIRASGSTPSDGDPRSMVEQRLRGGPTLVILDNVEHLGPEANIGEIIGYLLRQAGTKVLATSRRRLGLPGEIEVRLPPLRTPSVTSDANSVLNSESGSLFCQRAQAVRPDFRIDASNARDVAALCVALDGIPLALELAAARAQVLTPAQMLSRLGERLDRFVARHGSAEKRHRTLRETIEWSTRLLSPKAAAFLPRLSVFSGGWTLELAEEVLDEPLALDLLDELTDASLVVSENNGDQMRFRMLETIGLFASERLSQEEAELLRTRHAEVMLRFAEQYEETLATASPEVLATIETEIENLRASMNHYASIVPPMEAGHGSQTPSTPNPVIEAGVEEKSARFVAALWRFWHLRGYIREGREWTVRLLAPGPILAAAEHGAGRLAYLQGDYAEAEARYHDAHRLATQAGNSKGIAQSQAGLGSVAYERGHFAEALDLFTKSLTTFRDLDDRPNIGATLNWLGIVTTDLREYDRARTYLEKSYKIRKQIGDRPGIARALTSLGIVRRQQGNLAEAKASYEEALAIHRTIGDRRAEGGCLSNLGFVETRLGNLDLAEHHLGESIEILEQVGDKWGLAAALANLGNLKVAQGDPKLGLSLHRRSLRLRNEIGNQQGIALSFEGMATAYERIGDAPRTLAYLLAAQDLRKRLGTTLAPSDEGEILDRLNWASQKLNNAQLQHAKQRSQWLVEAVLRAR